MSDPTKSSTEIFLEDIKPIAQAIDLSQLKNKSILLTGASGILGLSFAHLIYYLNTELGYDITADFITRNPVGPTSFLRGMAVANTPGISFSTKDLSEPVAYDRPYDFMIHAAGYGSPSVFTQDPIRTININYIGIKSILESAEKKNPKAKILYFSSSEIYGSPPASAIPTPETFVGNSAITSNRACYVESKRLSEVLCLAYRAKGIDVKIARPALTYGPGLTFSSGRVISEFMQKAYLTKKIDMKDDGRDLRAYCYVSDALNQLLHILLGAKEAIYNVGSPDDEISVRQLAEKIGAIMGAAVAVGPGKDATVAAAPSRVCLDMTKASGEFGDIKPKVRMDEGLRRMIEWNLALIKEGILKV
jgi:nucleoside-diphosphate-sugar epimerase